MQEQPTEVELRELPDRDRQATSADSPSPSSSSSPQLHSNANQTARPNRQLKASTRRQFDALLQKSLTLQKRRWAINILLLCFPLLLSGILKLIDTAIKDAIDSDSNLRCGCFCIEWEDGKTSEECQFAGDDCKCAKEDKTMCGLEFSNFEQSQWCAIDNPEVVQAFVQTPFANMRAKLPIKDGAPQDCTGPDCPTLTLVTGGANSETLQSLTAAVLPGADASYLGTPSEPALTYYREPALESGEFVYLLSETCEGVSEMELMERFEELTGSDVLFSELECAPMVVSARDSAQIIEQEIYNGWEEGSPFENETNQYLAAVDFKDTNLGENNEKFSASIYLNFTYGGEREPPDGHRLVGFIHTVTNSFLKNLNANYKVTFKGIRETPKAQSKLVLDFSSLIGPLFYMWIFQLPLPLIISELVLERENRIRQMMKLQGLDEISYMSATYLYHTVFYIIYAFCVFILGVALDLQFFLANSITLQIVFYLLYGILQVSFAFAVHYIFRSYMVAIVSSFLYVFVFSLMVNIVLPNWIETGVSEVPLTFTQLVPAFGLFRGLYEFSQYSFLAGYQNTDGMLWSNLRDSENGLGTVLIIFAVEIVFFTVLSLAIDSDTFRNYCYQSYKKITSKLSKNSAGDKINKSPLLPVNTPLPTNYSAHDPEDVRKERERTLNPAPVISDPLNPAAASQQESVIRVLELRAVYPGQDGNPDKVAVDNVCFSVGHGECLGLLGPNGAGKSTTFNMLCGFISPTSGDALVCGHSIVSNQNEMNALIGVCPQDNLLWDTLTIREHFVFYGRLKNLSGVQLLKEVNTTLRDLNLENKANEQVMRLSGGMKRRVSVGISLIGDPYVCYLDEPSTGLDPNSRKNLWAAVKKAKQSKGMILTTHSMEEAEELCDRIAIVVNGKLKCIGTPQDLSSRFGSKLILSATLNSDEDAPTLERLVKELSPAAILTFNKYQTYKYDIPKESVSLLSIFTKMDKASIKLSDWTVSTATMEDVFLSVSGNVVKH